MIIFDLLVYTFHRAALMGIYST